MLWSCIAPFLSFKSTCLIATLCDWRSGGGQIPPPWGADDFSSLAWCKDRQNQANCYICDLFEPFRAHVLLPCLLPPRGSREERGWVRWCWSFCCHLFHGILICAVLTVKIFSRICFVCYRLVYYHYYLGQACDVWATTVRHCLSHL